jgi:AI-2E family transporter
VIDLIPMVGVTLGAVSVVLAALSVSPLKAVIMLAYIIVYQQIESNVLNPLIYGRSDQLPALTVFLAFLVGSLLWGILGALIAIPAANIIRILVREGWRRTGQTCKRPPRPARPGRRYDPVRSDANPANGRRRGEFPYNTDEVSDPTRAFPWANIGLIVVNLLVFFFELALGTQGSALDRFLNGFSLALRTPTAPSTRRGRSRLLRGHAVACAWTGGHPSARPRGRSACRRCPSWRRHKEKVGAQATRDAAAVGQAEAAQGCLWRRAAPRWER